MSTYCRECGAEVNEKAEICPECGVRVSEESNKQGTNTESGLDENVAGALAYILGLLSGLFFYVTEEDNEFVRFHAMQSILFSLVAFVGIWILNMILFSVFFSPTGFGAFGAISLVINLVSLASVGAWIFLMFKAYNGERYKLPVLGDFAEQNI